jgi:hypothetical protein
MQRQNSTPGAQGAKRPTTNSKRRGNASSRDANTTRSKNEAARSYRQTALVSDDDDKPQATRRSKKDNTSTQGKRSAQPLAKRPAPVGGSSRTKKRAPQGSTRRAKMVTDDNKGRTTPANGSKGSSAKRAKSSK